jgi:hypothetical protein
MPKILDGKREVITYKEHVVYFHNPVPISELHGIE